jgi:hypothetical protein
MVVQGTVDSPIATVCGWPNVQAMTLPETHNPRRTRLAVVGFAALTLLFLAGCSNAVEPGTSVFSREAIPAEATPMFASDKEAAAAAERAYRNYIDVSDQIARDGGANVERLKPFVTADAFSQDSEAADLYSRGNLHASGSTTVDSFRIQAFSVNDSVLLVDAYVCLRFESLRILDINEVDVTPATRSESVPIVVGFLSTEPTSELLLNVSEVWTGTNFC